VGSSSVNVVAIGALVLAVGLSACGGNGANSGAGGPTSSPAGDTEVFDTVVSLDLMNDFMPGIVGATILTDPNWPTNGSKDCEGTEEFAFIKEGAALTVADATGATVALARLPQGQDVRASESLPIQCNFKVPIAGIPAESQFYSVTIEGGEPVQLTSDELQAGPELLFPGESRR
jgi:hypothetical protein